MSKYNWSCSTCGMSSGRKYSVRRHIQNYNIHYGVGNVIPFVEYTIGRTEGKYRSGKVPQSSRLSSDFFERILDKVAGEFENQFVKEIANRIYDDMSKDPANQMVFDNIVTLANPHIRSKILRNLIKNTRS